MTGASDFAEQGRARVEGKNRGGVRLWADAEGRLTGGEMLGPAVEHHAHLLAHAVRDGLAATEMCDRPVSHPTVEEGFTSAVSEIVHEIGSP